MTLCVVLPTCNERPRIERARHTVVFGVVDGMRGTNLPRSGCYNFAFLRG